MKVSVELGTAPQDEPLIHGIEDDYILKTQAQCNAYCEQLKRAFGPEPGSSFLTVKCFIYELGNGWEVVYRYDDSVDEEVDYADRLQSQPLCHWDRRAKRDYGRLLRPERPKILELLEPRKKVQAYRV